MALYLHILATSASFSSSYSSRLRINRITLHRTPKISSHVKFPTKRSAIIVNCSTVDLQRPGTYQYQPTIWDYDFVESIKSNSMGEQSMHKMEKRKKEVCDMLENAVTPLVQLELINTIQRLGIGYCFEEEIMKTLEIIYSDRDKEENCRMKHNLYATALSFRLLRQYGFQVSLDVFSCFINAKGGLNESVSKDVKGILSLYEALHLVCNGENNLEDTRVLVTRHLKDLLEGGKILPLNLTNQVRHSLEIPLHWRMQRAEARWFINDYESETNFNLRLLEFAKLNFNLVQASHQADLKKMSRWWSDLGLASELNFARDRLVISFLFTIGVSMEPQHARCREWLTQVMNFVLIIDDIFDVYGSLDELELFTNAVERWDMKAIEELPHYMKIGFLGLYNTINNIAFDYLRIGGSNILPYLVKSWANFIKAMLVEAKWCNEGYTPSLQEYLDNGWISSSGSVFLIHAFFAAKQNIKSDELEALECNHNLLYSASMLCRLSNDLATSTAEIRRGDLASSIYCYMRETDSSEKDARRHVRRLILDTWKKMNGSMSDSTFDLGFINIAFNFARTCIFIYEDGDGIGAEDTNTRDHIFSLLVNPVQIVPQKAPLVK